MSIIILQGRPLLLCEQEWHGGWAVRGQEGCGLLARPHCPTGVGGDGQEEVKVSVEGLVRV